MSSTPHSLEEFRMLLFSDKLKLTDYIYHNHIHLDEFDYEEDKEIYYYPCPCGSRFEISKTELMHVDITALSLTYHITSLLCWNCHLELTLKFDQIEFCIQEELNRMEEIEKVTEDMERLHMTKCSDHKQLNALAAASCEILAETGAQPSPLYLSSSKSKICVSNSFCGIWGHS